MFGIAWGVGSLLLLVGLGEGFRSGQHKQLADMGTNVMFLFPGRTPAVEGSLRSMRPYRLTYDDYLAVREQAKLVAAVSPVLGRGDVRAVTESNSSAGGVTGVSASYNDIRNIPLQAGRWINEADDEERRNVAVIGSESARTLFPGKPAVGNAMLLNDARFEVIGVMRRIGREENNGRNIRVFIPVRTMMLQFPIKGEMQRGAIGFINYRPRVRGEHEAAKDEVHRIVAARHGFDAKSTDAFEDGDTVKEEETVGKIWDAMDWFLGSVGVVTLGLGAIGIINIMLVSVTERTQEIGLRKAIGARRRDILLQFFLEGAFLTIFSGFVGAFVTVALMQGLKRAPLPPGFDPPHIVPLSAAAAIIALGIAGTAAGLYPARRAAMLTPVEALRQE
jgi:putative ABC transport system permease protein